MELDLPTLFVTAVFASAVAGLLLLLSWLQNRNVGALALWAAAFMFGSVGVALVSERGNIPDIWSVVIANAITSTAYGMMWGGARHFNGRPAPVAFVLAGAVIWLLACQIVGFPNSPGPRAALISAIVVAYSVLCAWEFWQGRDEGLLSRWPIVVFLLAHAAVVIVRIPLAGSLSLPVVSEDVHIGWWTFIIFETIFFSFCAAYLLGGMARERIALRYKQASLIDPLTGVNNRRAFLERGEQLLRRSNFGDSPAAVLVFDLDKFKTVNDTFGHQTGDRVLTAFCRVATSTLRPGDLFGRLGGEEFAALLLHTSLNGGLVAAERVRANFEATALDLGEHTLTVSVGVASAPECKRKLAELIEEADRALYHAKENGRNRVACKHRVACR
jgi:diguanylate cyclase (GGDEF)-like protein